MHMAALMFGSMIVGSWVLTSMFARTVIHKVSGF